MEKMNKEKIFEIEIAKEYGQELVDKIKRLPDETPGIIQGIYTDKQYTSNSMQL